MKSSRRRYGRVVGGDEKNKRGKGVMRGEREKIDSGKEREHRVWSGAMSGELSSNMVIREDNRECGR